MTPDLEAWARERAKQQSYRFDADQEHTYYVAMRDVLLLIDAARRAVSVETGKVALYIAVDRLRDELRKLGVPEGE